MVGYKISSTFVLFSYKPSVGKGKSALGYLAHYGLKGGTWKLKLLVGSDEATYQLICHSYEPSGMACITTLHILCRAMT